MERHLAVEGADQQQQKALTVTAASAQVEYLNTVEQVKTTLTLQQKKDNTCKLAVDFFMIQ
jgi:hypothetical protein